MKGSGAVSRLTAPQRSVVGQLRVYLELAKGGTDPLSWIVALFEDAVPG